MGSQVELHGMRIGIEGEPAASVKRALEVLDHFGATACPKDRPDLQVAFSVAPPPEHSRPPETARHLDMTIHRAAEELWLCSPSTTTRIDVRGELARVTSHDEQPVPLHVFTCVLFHQLRARGRYALHAATVSRDGRGCMIVGPSGAGKSTLTLALLQLGWDLVSDDSVLLTRSGSRVLALRRGVYLEPESLPQPPAGSQWRPCPLVEAVKQELLLRDVSRAEATTAAVVLLPEIVDADRTTFEPVEPIDACWALASESRLSELDRAGAADHLAVLCTLAGRVRAFRARLGRDVLRAPAGVSDQLRRLLDAQPLPSAEPPERSSEEGFDRRRLEQPVYASMPHGGGVLLHPVSLDFFALDAVGARIWELSHLPPARIADELVRELEAPHDEILAEVQLFLEDLANQGFIPPPCTS